VKSLLPALVLSLAAGVAFAADDDLDDAFGKDVLIIEASKHACYRFDVYLALNREQQLRGLMFVREMPATTGMLFVYDYVAVHSMWMKNTFLSLDMIFAYQDGTIDSIARNTEPLSLRSVASSGPVTFVLELNAGSAERLGIDENSRLIWEPAQRDDE